MTLVELFTHLRNCDVKIWADGNRLRYSAPPSVITPDLRVELAKHKEDILGFLNNANDAEVLATAIQRVSHHRKLPVSFTQHRLWFVDQLSPNTSTFHSAKALRLIGPLNVTVLDKCLNEIVQRHEVLRTLFTVLDGELYQDITPPLASRLPIVDLSATSAITAEREDEALSLVKQEVERLFNLAEAPAYRAKLIRLSNEDHILILTMHHLVTDGLSWGVFFRELTALYNAFIVEKLSPLPELPVQYADFVHWQRGWLQGKVAEQKLSYWKNQLYGTAELLELPIDHPRPAVQSFRGANQSMTLSKDLTDKLKTLSRQEGVTLFMVLLAAFQILLCRLTGQEDIAVGSPIAGRNRSELDGLIGLFINTLVLRTDLSGNPSFRKLLRRVRDVALGAYGHQETPFEKVMEELRLERHLAYSALFQVMFVLQNNEDYVPELAGLNVSRLKLKKSTSMYDLFFSLVEVTDELYGTMFFRTDLFDTATIRRMLGNFQVLLEAIVTNPEQPLSALPLLTKSERQQLLLEWNDTKRTSVSNRCVHELFEERAGRTPEATAVLFEEERFSYRQLNQKANQLAHHLQALGVGPGVLVGLCMERSLEMIVGILGVLKAGGAYVPLDPNYPSERLAFMLEDTQTPVLLTQKKFVGSLFEMINPDKSVPTIQNRQSKIKNVSVVCLDTDWETISRESEENLAVGVNAEDLAYVIYTSGSTGRAKGVEITQRALANFVHHTGETLALQSDDRVLQFASIGFDTAVEEIFPCLIRGATLVLRTEGMIDSVSQFLETCREWGVTVLDLPTVYWHELTESLCSERLTIPEQLRLVIIGGEKAIQERLAQWHKAIGNRVRLLNTYGPTEATVVATVWEADGSALPDELLQEVPIGRPITNVQTYILDRHLNPVPIGVRGELHIGGAGLANGYLNCPDLTAERFIPSPFSDHAGARLYKTGDLARYLPDGNIEFLGRIDNQVKIRGFRIELGEIEAVLRQHVSVREVAVVARQDATEENSVAEHLNPAPRLVAYVVPHHEQTVTISDLRGLVKQKLPNYMIPSAFVFLDTLPLTPNGKVDYNGLPAPDQSRPDLEDAFVAPQTPTEKTLAVIWAEILKVEKIGVHDNFFDLGGHSLLAVRVISRVRDALQIDLPLRTLFENPTVTELTEAIASDPIGRCRTEKAAQLFLKLSQLSNEEVERLLSEKHSLMRKGVH